MRRTAVIAAAVGAAVVTAVGWSIGSASAITSPQTFHLHEHDTGNAFLDLGAKGPSIGDELVGSSRLTTTKGAVIGTDSFVCTTVVPNDSKFQCTVVYDFGSNRVTGQGEATITGTHPLFDELFAITGGTHGYRNVRGEVRILQSSQTDAELYFTLIP